MNHRDLWRPKLKELPERCASCPFRDDNDEEFGKVIDKLCESMNLIPEGGADIEGTRENIREDVSHRGDFACHSTAYDDAMQVVPLHKRKQCPGATAYFKSHGEEMVPVSEITSEEFDEGLKDVLDEIYGPGAAKLAQAHGDIWSTVSEEYNNQAIDKAKENRE